MKRASTPRPAANGSTKTPAIESVTAEIHALKTKLDVVDEKLSLLLAEAGEGDLRAAQQQPAAHHVAERHEQHDGEHPGCGRPRLDEGRQHVEHEGASGCRTRGFADGRPGRPTTGPRTARPEQGTRETRRTCRLPRGDQSCGVWPSNVARIEQRKREI